VENAIYDKEAELSWLDPAVDADRIAALQGEISALKGRKDELDGQISAIQSDYDGRISAAQRDCDTLSGQLAQAERDLSDLQAERDTVLGDMNSLIATLQGNIAAAEATLGTLTPSPDAERRAQIEAALAEKRPALEGVNNDITAT